MNVSELYHLTEWVTEEIVNTQLPQKYHALQSILAQNAQQNRQQQAFESQKDDLIETIKNVPLNELSMDQINFLEQLNIAPYVGKNGIQLIEDILYKNVIDILTSSTKLQEIYTFINQGLNKVKQIQQGLSGCIVEEKYELDDEILMRIAFTGHAEINNVVDFKKWGALWHDIGRGIAMIHDKTPNDDLSTLFQTNNLKS